LPLEVSIITVYYNSPEDLLALHDSIQAHLPLESFEWIVADNNSETDLSEKLPDVIYLRLPENYGFAKANNLAAKKARAPFLFFVNPDCLFIENSIPTLLDAMKSAAVAGPKVLNEDGTTQLSFGPFLSIYAEFRQKRRMKKEKAPEMQKWIRSRGKFYPDYVSGCALMIATDLYQKLGGFDEEFFLYEEDVDLCKRVTDLGKRVIYEPSTSMIHGRNKSVAKVSNRVLMEYRKSQMYYYQKHHGWLQNFLLKLYKYGALASAGIVDRRL
jgi:GT2 family glycosyltransferase